MGKTTIYIAAGIGAALLGAGFLLSKLAKPAKNPVSLHLHNSIFDAEDCDVCDDVDVDNDSDDGDNDELSYI